jgi:hypothetical protein
MFCSGSLLIRLLISGSRVCEFRARFLFSLGFLLVIVGLAYLHARLEIKYGSAIRFICCARRIGDSRVRSIRPELL